MQAINPLLGAKAVALDLSIEQAIARQLPVLSEFAEDSANIIAGKGKAKSSSSKSSMGRRQSAADVLSADDLQALFKYTLKEASKLTGYSCSTLKRAVQSHGFRRWGYRKLRSQRFRDATASRWDELSENADI